MNLPFYALAWLRMGPRFTLNTFAAVATVSFMTDHPQRRAANRQDRNPSMQH